MSAMQGGNGAEEPMSIACTADICPHGGSSSLCEWCGYKAQVQLLLKGREELKAEASKLRAMWLELMEKPSYYGKAVRYRLDCWKLRQEREKLNRQIEMALLPAVECSCLKKRSNK